MGICDHEGDLIVKIQIGGESYRRRVSSESFTTNVLHTLATSACGYQTLNFYYKDGDGDDITLKNNEDLHEALLVMAEKNKSGFLEVEAQIPTDCKREASKFLPLDQNTVLSSQLVEAKYSLRKMVPAKTQMCVAMANGRVNLDNQIKEGIKLRETSPTLRKTLLPSSMLGCQIQENIQLRKRRELIKTKDALRKTNQRDYLRRQIKEGVQLRETSFPHVNSAPSLIQQIKEGVNLRSSIHAHRRRPPKQGDLISALRERRQRMRPPQVLSRDPNSCDLFRLHPVQWMHARRSSNDVNALLRNIQKSAKPKRVFLYELEKCLQQKIVYTEESFDPVNCRHRRTNLKTGVSKWVPHETGDQWFLDAKKKQGGKSYSSIFPAMMTIFSQEPPSMLQALLFHPSFAKFLEKCLKFLKERHSAQDCIDTRCFSRLKILSLRDLAQNEAGLRKLWADNECIELARWLCSQIPALAPLFTKFGREMVVSDLKEHFSNSKFCSFKSKVNHKIAMDELQQTSRYRNAQRDDKLIGAIQNMSAPIQNRHAVEGESFPQRSNIDQAFFSAIHDLPAVVRRSHELCRQRGTAIDRGIQPIRNVQRQVVMKPSKVSKEMYAAIQKLPEVVRRSHELCKGHERYDNMDNDFVVVQTPVPWAGHHQPQMARAVPSTQPYAEAVQTIIAMGFNDIDIIQAAISAESGNISRAVECLLR